MNDTTALATQAASVVAFTARDAFELELRQAKVYSSATIVPEQYRDNIANCMIALNMARRIGSDPLQTMQSLYIVHGRPGWSGQFLIATFNQCGRFTAMRFEWQGKPNTKDWGCRAYATEKSTGERIDGPWVTWAMVEAEGWASKAGSKWKTIPELMFHYRAGAFLVRTHAPEISMGLQTVEEIGDVIDVTPTAPDSAALQKINAEITGKTGDTETSSVSFTYAQIAEKIAHAETGDALAEAEDLIGAVPDPGHQLELRKLAKERHDRAD
jgi:hypothetical protein